MTCDEVKPLLNARMDGEIDAIESAAIDAHVESCPSCAVEMEAIGSVRAAIRDEMRYHQAPAHLRERVKSALRGAEYLEGSARRTNWKTWGAIAAVLVLTVLGATPFLMNARNQRQLVADELLSAHVRALLGRELDVVSSDQHNVKPWFNGKVPFSPQVTDLSAEGFPLEGGRLDYVGGHRVAALVYGRRLHRIDVFVWPSDRQTAPPSHFERDGYNQISWTKNEFVFTAVSDLNAAELNTFASLLKRP
jgi:anti-sigma factor (TIGR02949 family)